MTFPTPLAPISRAAACIALVAMAGLTGCVETMPKLQNIVADFNATAPDVQGGWSGTYVRTQGKTAVRLYLTANGPQAFSGRFDFGNLPGQNNSFTGSFAINGVIGNGKVNLTPVRWINRPANYQPVSVQAAFFRGPDRMVGNVNEAGCGPFAVTRDASVLASPAAAVNAPAVVSAAKVPATQAPVPASKTAAAPAQGMSFDVFLKRLGTQKTSSFVETTLHLKLRPGAIAGA